MWVATSSPPVAASSRKSRIRTRAASSGSCSKPLYQSGWSNPTWNTSVAGERQPVAAGRQADHAVPGGVAAGAVTTTTPGATSYSSSNVRNWLRYSFANRLAGRRSASGKPGGMDDAGEIGRLPELDLGGRHVDPQVRAQPLLHAVDEQPANVVHVHVGQHHVGHGCEIDAGGLEPLDHCPARGKSRSGIRPQPSVDEYGLAAAAHHDHVQRPIERVRRQEHVVQPGRPDGRVGVVGQTSRSAAAARHR